jgi:hypothetical protein
VSKHGSLDLSQSADGGVYYVNPHDFESLALAAGEAKLYICRIDLTACKDKTDLLHRLAKALHLPSTFGFNWDALLDSLRDLGWLLGDGHALLIDHANDLRRAAAGDFETMIGILSDAANFAATQNRPFFAFLSLPDKVIKHTSRI